MEPLESIAKLVRRRDSARLKMIVERGRVPSDRRAACLDSDDDEDESVSSDSDHSVTPYSVVSQDSGHLEDDWSMVQTAMPDHGDDF